MKKLKSFISIAGPLSILFTKDGTKNHFLASIYFRNMYLIYDMIYDKEKSNTVCRQLIRR